MERGDQVPLGTEMSPSSWMQRSMSSNTIAMPVASPKASAAYMVANLKRTLHPTKILSTVETLKKNAFRVLKRALRVRFLVEILVLMSILARDNFRVAG